MTTAEKVLAVLREKPLTRLDISMHILDVTGRAVQYQLNNLQTYGFIKKCGGKRNTTYQLIKEDGLLVECNCCLIRRPCWQIKKGTCNYCKNVRGYGEAKPSKARKALSQRASLFARDDACSLAYQRLLRGQQIGITN
ncbi:hypothetical protein [Photobacterium sanguinicancri]|uniref:hypothetical protein n=1 Tax=Photobacterium sanguinicancri TaxID=875932 RepID=UPI0026E3CE15|nr:hypothetical protein [Photobacterium sanguinicancri]MDO6497354.1 hypothetical protein [Photobacterium sanguinicancri]